LKELFKIRLDGGILIGLYGAAGHHNINNELFGLMTVTHNCVPPEALVADFVIRLDLVFFELEARVVLNLLSHAQRNIGKNETVVRCVH
jgi:hypothetical protein